MANAKLAKECGLYFLCGMRITKILVAFMYYCKRVVLWQRDKGSKATQRLLYVALGQLMVTRRQFRIKIGQVMTNVLTYQFIEECVLRYHPVRLSRLSIEQDMCTQSGGAAVNPEDTVMAM